MKRIILMLTVAAMMVVALTIAAPMAFAQNAPPGCTKERGTITCPSDAKNDKFEGNQVTTKKGSTQSSHEEETTCVQRPCPPGQFN
jgi:hypothetical protein